MKGINLESTSPTGHSSNYWVVKRIDNNPIEGTSNVCLYLYKDKDAFTNGSSPSKYIDMQFDTETGFNNADANAAVLASDDFSGSTEEE